MFALESAYIGSEDVFWLMASAARGFLMAACEFKACFFVIKGERIEAHRNKFNTEMLLVALSAVLIGKRGVITPVCRNTILNGHVAIEAAGIICTSLS